MGLRQGENPARWKANLDAVFDADKTEVRAHAALPYRELPALMAKLRSTERVAERSLEMLTLTAVRAGELLDMTWGEVDMGAKLWSIPAKRMKSRKPMRVPPSDRVIEILKALKPKGNGTAAKPADLVFVGERSGKAMKAEIPSKVLKALTDASITVHGLRSTFRDWAAEQTAFSNDVAEAALAHTVGSSVERAYRRTDHFEQRIKLMQMWDDYCASPPAAAEAGGKVVPIRHKVRREA
jgi:integrase